MEGATDPNGPRRRAFSSATGAAAYETGRPGYPDRVYEILRETCGLGPGTRLLEIGPGTGQATGRLLDLGASVVAVELGGELAERLQRRYGTRDLVVQTGAFEDLEVTPGWFDLITAATSFHWVPTDDGLHRCADALAPGGWLALWWTFFGDPDRPDPFHEALTARLATLAPSLLDVPGASGSAGDAGPYALDAAARTGEIDATGRFGPVHHEVIAWTGRHTAREVRALFGSFSPWLLLPDGQREEVLDEVERLARDEFGDLVERPYLTPVYVAQRRA
ncbi:class I SAM-dependent methyltransferase [soil metagenome]